MVYVGTDAGVLLCLDLESGQEIWRYRPGGDEDFAGGRIRLEGPRDLKRAFPNWLLLSAVAHVDRQRPGRERAARLRSASRR